MTTPDDNFYAEDIVKANPRVRALITEKYGISEADMDEVLICDTWALHNAPPHLNHRRLMQGFLYLKLKGAHAAAACSCACLPAPRAYCRHACACGNCTARYRLQR
jgi:hypothetical protein